MYEKVIKLDPYNKYNNKGYYNNYYIFIRIFTSWFVKTTRKLDYVNAYYNMGYSNNYYILENSLCNP